MFRPLVTDMVGPLLGSIHGETESIWQPHGEDWHATASLPLFHRRRAGCVVVATSALASGRCLSAGSRAPCCGTPGVSAAFFGTSCPSLRRPGELLASSPLRIRQNICHGTDTSLAAPLPSDASHQLRCATCSGIGGSFLDCGELGASASFEEVPDSVVRADALSSKAEEDAAYWVDLSKNVRDTARMASRTTWAAVIIAPVFATLGISAAMLDWKTLSSSMEGIEEEELLLEGSGWPGYLRRIDRLEAAEL
uniref:Uncharacterized protein n=1 Tax=Noctiluca scintillans TaxID=2966 RepID=A0A7S0ZYW6_NOCSC|mmetsp:Transcript_24856/g.65307  ORF Transcript_24856/g.65307 Transcript_24856/m.65307 type:complete len:252 (+) Transcript_24856:59-814(+)